MHRLLFALLISLCQVSADISPSSTNSIFASLRNKSAVSRYEFSFSNTLRIDSNAYVTVEFPQEFEDGLGLTTCIGYRKVNTLATSVPCTIQGRKVQWEFQTLDAGKHVLGVINITNPSASGTTGQFSVTTSKGMFESESNPSFGLITITQESAAFTSVAL